MNVKCTKCEFSGEVPDSFVGKKIKCPKCQTEFAVASESAFSVVEEPTVLKKSVISIKEVAIGKIGPLEVTNKRIHGQITKLVPTPQGGYATQTASVDVLLNLLTGVTVRHVNNLRFRICCILLAIFGVLLLGIGLAGVVGKEEFLGGISCVVSAGFIGSALGIGLKNWKDRLWLVLSISGVDHVIPFGMSEKILADKYCATLKNAKSEYERLMGM